MREDFLSRQQLNLILKRIDAAQLNMTSMNVKFDILNFINYKSGNGSIIIVGSGGSYPAAVYGKYVLEKYFGNEKIEAATPQTAIRIIENLWENRRDIDNKLVIGISYSGKTKDIQCLANTCISKGYKFLMITAGVEKEIYDQLCKGDVASKRLIKIYSYHSQLDDAIGYERGMISMSSTLIPCLLFANMMKWDEGIFLRKCIKQGKEYVSGLEIPKMAKAIRESPTIHVFYEWESFPTAIDIESKVTESGIANVVLHEKKNFSHGRANIMYKQYFGMVINLVGYKIKGDNTLVKKTEYDRMLSEFLRKISEKRGAYYLEMGDLGETVEEWNFQQLSKLPYLFTAIGEEMEIDISKSLLHYSKVLDELYEYSGKI